MEEKRSLNSHRQVWGERDIYPFQQYDRHIDNGNFANNVLPNLLILLTNLDFNCCQSLIVSEKH